MLRTASRSWFVGRIGCVSEVCLCTGYTASTGYQNPSSCFFFSCWLLLKGKISIIFYSRLEDGPRLCISLIKMCTTTKFYFSCRHDATKRFQIISCQNHPACHVIDHRTWLNQRCPGCQDRKRRRDGSPPSAGQGRGVATQRWEDFQNDQKRMDEVVWIVPEIEFWDPGFQSVDPFKDDRMKVFQKRVQKM